MGTTVKERLVSFVKFKGISISTFQKSIGVGNGYVNNIRKSIQPDKIEGISLNYPELNIEWLLTGKGLMLKDGESEERPTYPMGRVVDRFYEYIEYKGLTADKVSSILGVHPSTLSKAKGSKYDLSWSMIDSILNHMHEIDPIWFMTGQGKMLKGEVVAGTSTLSGSKERLLQFIKYKGFSKTEFAKFIGISESNLKGKALESELSGDTTYKVLSQFPELNGEWLMTGQGEMVKGVEAEDGVAVRRYAIEPEGIPLYDVDFACGFMQMYNDYDTDPIGYYNVAPFNNPKRYASVRATGDSMYPRIKSGDFVIIDRDSIQLEDVIYGDVYAVVTDSDMRTIKYVVRSEEADCIRLVPENTSSRFGTFQDIPKRKILQIFRVRATINYQVF